MAENITRVTDEHPDYVATLTQWSRIEDALAGKDAIHRRKEIYLPKLAGQIEEQYDAYLKRTPWYGATARTLEAMVGMVFRKPPITSMGVESQNVWLEDITLSDETYEEFAKDIYRSIVSLGRAGIFVDFVTDLQKEEGEETERPYLAQYDARSIRNWRTRRIGGKTTLDQVVLREDHEVPDDAGFGTTSKIRYRVLELKPIEQVVELMSVFDLASLQFPDNKKAAYCVSVWESFEQASMSGIDPTKTEWRIAEFYVPNRSGITLDDIPFVFISPIGTKTRVEKPPLLDMVDTNFDHYRLSADYRHGLHFTALPTAWVAGFPIDTKLEIGSEAAWVSDDPSANAGFLEFTGQGLNPLREAVEATENKMAVLGARLLETQKKMAETAETWRIRQGGEQSILLSSIDAVTKGMIKALGWMSWWGGAEELNVTSAINRDLVSAQVDPQMFAQMLQALLAGKISQQLWLEFLEEGEILRTRSPEEELEQIETEEINKLLSEDSELDEDEPEGMLEVSTIPRAA